MDTQKQHQKYMLFYNIQLILSRLPFHSWKQFRYICEYILILNGIVP